MLSYAQHPTGWSPALFAGYAKSDSSSELAWIVETCFAIHEKALLEIADEIRAPGADLKYYQSQLGALLTQELVTCDISKFESHVIELFTDLAKQHGSKTIGGQSVEDLADGSVFSVQHLRLGKQVTTLLGESVDGEKITLDEYRGRVILVDFLGNVGAHPVPLLYHGSKRFSRTWTKRDLRSLASVPIRMRNYCKSS